MKARILCIVMLTLLCASCGGGSNGAPPTPAPNTTVQVPGLMKVGRWTPAVTLKSGDVLEVGGLGSLTSEVLASGEVYHPKTDSFTLVANQLPIAAYRICLAALNDGTALEVGGIDSSGNALLQAEIYDPASNSFAPTKGPMNDARYGCTATTLQDGTVLIAGGDNSSGRRTRQGGALQSQNGRLLLHQRQDDRPARVSRRGPARRRQGFAGRRTERRWNGADERRALRSDVRDLQRHRGAA